MLERECENVSVCVYVHVLQRARVCECYGESVLRTVCARMRVSVALREGSCAGPLCPALAAAASSQQ